MVNKQEYMVNLLCSACLCIEPKLHEIVEDKQKQFYLDAVREIPLSSEQVAPPRACWRCVASLRRAVAFREQVQDSYRILQTYTNENLSECLLSDVSRIPRLVTHRAHSVDIPPSFHVELDLPSDEVKCEPDPEVQSVFVKDEEGWGLHDEDDVKGEKCPSDFGEDPTHSDLSDDIDTLESEVKALMGNEVIETKKEGSKKKKKKLVKTERKKKPAKTRQNILTIELTYEELMVERIQLSEAPAYRAAAYKCDDCIISFPCERSLREHLAKHAEDLGSCRCPVCARVLPSVDHFTRHYKRHTRRYECASCGKRTEDRKTVQSHFDTEHSDNRKRYTCDKCGHLSLTVDAHRYHRDSHKARVPCAQCDKTFSHRAGLMTHTVAVHKMNNSFPCAVCGKVFRWRTSLNKHMEQHDNKGGPAAAHCVSCDVSFRSVCSYKRHLKNSLKHVTHEQLKFVCDPCGRRYSNKTKLRDHIEEKHLHRAFSCPTCHKPSKNRVCLEQHIRNVHLGRPATRMCHHCGKGFPTKVQLESHIRSHTGERPYICELCPTTFSQQSNLYKHTRQVHMNIKSKRYGVRRDADRPTGPTSGAPSGLGAPGPPVSGAPIEPPLVADIKTYHSHKTKGVLYDSDIC